MKNKILPIIVIVIFLVLGAWTFYTTKIYFENYSWKWQSPIIIREPLIISSKHNQTPSRALHGLLDPSIYSPAKETPVQLSPKELVKKKTIAEFGIDEWNMMEKLISSESNFDPFSINTSSGACGIFQALPCSKLPCKLSDVDCQVNWGVGYIKNRYGDVGKALAFHYANGWY